MSIADYGDLTAAEIVEELEATIEDLTADNARLAEQVKAIEPMRLEYERGGYDAVIVGLRESIRVLETRVYGESEDKAAWKRRADFWKAKALKLGWSRDLIIDIETGQEVSANG